MLPDYLPLVLEFFAAAPDWARVVLLDGFGKELIGIYAVLEARHPDSSYVSLFRPIVAVLGLVPDQRLPAKRLSKFRWRESIGEEEETFLSVGSPARFPSLLFSQSFWLMGNCEARSGYSRSNIFQYLDREEL